MTRVWSNTKTEPWSPADIKTMLGMLDAGSKMGDVARHLKRTRNSVIGKSNRERAKIKVAQRAQTGTEGIKTTPTCGFQGTPADAAQEPLPVHFRASGGGRYELLREACT